MRLSPFILGLALLPCAAAWAGSPTGAAGHPAKRQPLRPVSQCLRIEGIRDWHVLNPTTAVVASDRYYYRVTLSQRCPQLGVGADGLRFRANASNRHLGDSRLCGEAGETVRSNAQPPCAIQSVHLISKTQYQHLRDADARGAVHP